jgi:cytoskeletal protein RodZ
MTSQNTSSEPGYRGSLPSREDRLARPWILTVLGIFVLVLVLSIAGIPSRFIPDPTPVPLPSLPASISAEPSPSASASEPPSESPSASASESASPAP